MCNFLSLFAKLFSAAHRALNPNSAVSDRSDVHVGEELTDEIDDITYLMAAKRAIVTDLFIDTADDNYLVARWCFQNGLAIDFFWLAVHCLEKYMKAALLLNGLSAKDSGHEIEKLLRKIETIAPGCLPNLLTKPEQINVPFWRDETLTEFFTRLYSNGNAANRYNTFGHSVMPEDLFKLDRAVFAIRRLARPLDVHFLGKSYPGAPARTQLQQLQRQPGLWRLSLSGELENVGSGKRGEVLRHVFLNLNVLFAPPDYAHGEMPSRHSARNSVLARWIVDLVDEGQPKESQATGQELLAWALENIYFTKDVRQELKGLQRDDRP